MIQEHPTATIRIGKRGTVVIPSAIRQSLGLDEGDTLMVYESDGELRMVKVPADPIERLRWAMHNAYAGCEDPTALMHELRAEWRD